MAAYSTKLAEAFASKALQRFYARSVADVITNSDYEGDIKGVGAVVNVLTLDGMTIKTYNKTAMTADTLTESNAQLVCDQYRGYYFKVQTIQKLLSYIKDPENTIVDEAGKKLKKVVDQYVLGLYGDVAAGQRIGTDYTTGDCAIDADGNVTGNGTTFTAAMVGKPFKATGHTKWYRVKSRASNTAIVIENDEDDVTSHYDGGAINSGASYTIQAATAIQVTKDTIYGKIADLGVLLDDAEVPDDDRWIVVPPAVAALIKKSPEYTPAVPQAYNEVVRRGLVGDIAGFTVYKSPRVVGDSVNGWHVMAGHKAGITMAMAMTESKIEMDIPGDFGIAPKGLTVYGAKIIDERRKCLTELFCKL